MKNKSIYLMYCHEYNAGYVSKTGNFRTRFYDHCWDKRTCVKQFCDGKGVRARDMFCIYEILQCDKGEAAHYEGHIYDLIEAYIPQITLNNKNKADRGKQESRNNWHKKKLERCRACQKMAS